MQSNIVEKLSHYPFKFNKSYSLGNMYIYIYIYRIVFVSRPFSLLPTPRRGKKTNYQSLQKSGSYSLASIQKGVLLFQQKYHGSDLLILFQDTSNIFFNKNNHNKDIIKKLLI